MEINIAPLERLREALAQFPNATMLELMAAMEDSLGYMAQPVTVPGSRPGYPIRWDSQKQKMAFFRSDGFGKGIPTKRTGTVVTSWKREMTVAPDSIVGHLFNTYANAGYVQGDPNRAYGSPLRQSTIFRGAWPSAEHEWAKRRDDVIERFRQAVRNSLRFVR